ncbi:hypothetical protein RRG08_043112 [Elysia crispata]|uniref:Uncharacterized protein n=1 Tax=Elysia crispata TaxID=231223 RepID=A0AAE0XYE5_9GAST|nr:hypothetical protein RRG08_043112 [Elysia crispata]
MPEGGSVPHSFTVTPDTTTLHSILERLCHISVTPQYIVFYSLFVTSLSLSGTDMSASKVLVFAEVPSRCLG